MKLGGNPRLTSLWILDEKQAIKLVTRALDDHCGDVQATAARLGIARRTLTRWIQEHPALRISLERIREDVEMSK